MGLANLRQSIRRPSKSKGPTRSGVSEGHGEAAVARFRLIREWASARFGSAWGGWGNVSHDVFLVTWR